MADNIIVVTKANPTVTVYPANLYPPGPDTVGTTQIQDNSVTNAKIQDVDASKVTYNATTVKAQLDNTPTLTDLASTATGKGSDLVGYPDTLAPTYLKTTSDIINGLPVSLFRFVDPTKHSAIQAGVNSYDATADVADAVAALKGTGSLCFAPHGEYNLSSTITIDNDFFMSGAGCQPLNGSIGQLNTRGKGAWFHIAHTGVGFDVTQTGGTNNGTAKLQGFGIYRDQPDPTGLAAGAWTPTVNGADINMNSTDLTLLDLVLLNPTVGILVTAAGRLTATRIKGQPIDRGIDVVSATDTVSLNDFHWWPFWSNNAAVRDYQKKNTTGFKIGRCDNPHGSGLFTIGMWKGMELYTSAAGRISKGRFANLDFDSGEAGIIVSADDATSFFNNIAVQGNVADTTRTFHLVQVLAAATGARIFLENYSLKDSTGSCVRNEGNGSTIQLGQGEIANWNRASASYTGINANSSGAVILCGTPPVVPVGGVGGTATLNENTGAVLSCPLGRGVASATTDASGYITVTHGLSATPRGVEATPQGTAGYFCAVSSITSTTFKIRFSSSAGVVASTAVSAGWSAFY